ncbi:MAG: radical SAM family heme chaperone HemW [Lachnospiraceae bacterium]|nr:radical SAM family heme chaperone HemW [Lachnospiraceae bacterium]
MELELYIHIPFCVRKCAYCDFLSFEAGGDRQEAYVKALIREIHARGRDPRVQGKTVSSIFFGGGTPSILPPEWIREILDTVNVSFPVERDAEISLESNPGTLDTDKLNMYRKAGINRLSLGCQSTEDRELQLLGRIHTMDEFLESFARAREAGFSNINVDLMSGLPGQDSGSWETSLRRIAELRPEHISAYSLILEEGTPMYRQREQLAFPEEEEERRMYEDTCRVLKEYGYHQYEISNYCLEGKECRHNLGYWTGTEYLGLGLGAASLLENRRFSNCTDLLQYLSLADQPERLEQEAELLTEEDRMGERMILGLRLASGVSDSAFKQEFGRSLTEQYGSVIEKYIGWKLLEWTGDRLRLTREGISLSNQVMAEFL